MEFNGAIGGALDSQIVYTQCSLYSEYTNSIKWINTNRAHLPLDACHLRKYSIQRSLCHRKCYFQLKVMHPRGAFLYIIHFMIYCYCVCVSAGVGALVLSPTFAHCHFVTDTRCPVNWQRRHITMVSLLCVVGRRWRARFTQSVFKYKGTPPSSWISQIASDCVAYQLYAGM